MSIKVGDKAPDFELQDHKGKKFKLSANVGKKVLLVFHPLALTSVCEREMKNLDAIFEKLQEKNCVPVAISVDPVPTKQSMAKDCGIKKIRMLTDFWPHGKVAKLYNVFREVEGFSERANILIDEEGSIKMIKIYNLPELPDFKEILKKL